VKDASNLASPAREILEYLLANPYAQDTAEGIAQCWLGSMAPPPPLAKVQEALSQLVNRGWVIQCTGANGQSTYRLNPRARQPE